MSVDLSNKKILVTGATKGIGKAIAQELLTSGASVGIHGNSSMGGIDEWAGEKDNYIPIQADLRNPDEVVSLFDRFIDHFGSLDVLINNAGIAIESSWSKVDTDWIKDWDLTMNVNLKATALLCKKAMEHFSDEHGGIIINIASRAAFRGDTEDFLAYAASKGGMVALTRSIARGMGKKGISAFTVSPGFTRTEMAEQFIVSYGEAFVASDIALNKLTTPEDISPFIAFLASGKAEHATGSNFDFNAGSYVH